MPLSVERLTPTSSEEEVSKAISDSISQCVREGKEQKVCVAMVHTMARGATGKELAPKTAPRNEVATKRSTTVTGTKGMF